jgi:hypothetical protein
MDALIYPVIAEVIEHKRLIRIELQGLLKIVLPSSMRDLSSSL